jgi:antitoxin ParD1/3/4
MIGIEVIAMDEIKLSPEMKRFVEEKVRSGQFASASEVVHGALSALRAEEELSPGDVEELRREVAIGLEQADRGEFVAFTAETIITEGRHILANRNKAG